MNARRALCVAACVLLASTSPLDAARRTEALPADSLRPTPVLDPRPRLPLIFEPNRGQVSDGVDVITRARGYAAACEGAAVTLIPARGSSRVRMHFGDVGSTASFAPVEPLPGKTNYLLGNDPSEWVRHVDQFAGALALDVLPGVDVRLQGAPGRRVRYDLHLAPGADPADVRVRFDGAESVAVDASGTLVVSTGDGEFRHSPPVAYQNVGGARRDVASRFIVHDDRSVGFTTAQHDPSHALVIDPTIEYASYIGGTDNSFEQATGIAVDSTGAAYVHGETTSAALDTAAPYQAANGGQQDVFICKVNPAGDAHVYLTYLGGADEEQSKGIEVDGNGAACVVGRTASADFPTESPVQGSLRGSRDACVSKLSADGASLVFSTYFGGGDSDEARAVALGGDGSVYVTGKANSADFPVVAAVQPAHGGGREDAWVGKFAADGQTVVWATYLGGDSGDIDERGNGIGVTADGCCVVGGETPAADFPTEKPFQAGNSSAGSVRSGFVTKFNAAGDALVFSTFLGGDDRDIIEDLCVGPDGAAYAVGTTRSDNFPVAFPIDGERAEAGDDPDDLFVTKLSADGKALVYSTYLGDTDDESGAGIAVDGEGAAYVSGRTFSTSFPTRDAPLDTYSGGGDGIALKINPAGSALVYSTFLDTSSDVGGARGIAVDSTGAAYVAADVDSNGFPVHAQSVQPNYRGSHDALYVKLSPQAGNVPPPQTVRSFLLPKKLDVRVGSGKSKAPGVASKGFFDTGPGAVDFAAAAVVTVGPRDIAVPGLVAIKKGKAFNYAADGFEITVTPAKTGSSKAKYKLSLDEDLAGEVDLDGEFTLRYVGGGINAEGTVVLDAGRFKFGRRPGTLIRPEIDIRKAKAALPGVLKHKFKFVAGIAGDGLVPNDAPQTRVAFGEIFAVDLAASSLRRKKNAFVLGGPVGAGVKAVNLDFAKERIAVRGGNADLGDVPEGPVTLLLIVTIAGEERAVQVRAVRKGKVVKY